MNFDKGFFLWGGGGGGGKGCGVGTGVLGGGLAMEVINFF